MGPPETQASSKKHPTKLNHNEDVSKTTFSAPAEKGQPTPPNGITKDLHKLSVK